MEHARTVKKRVVLRGPALTQSGYGKHCREVASWLLTRPDFDVYFQPLPWGTTTWLLDRSRCEGLIGKIIERAVPFEERGFDVSCQVQLPHEWDPTLAKVNIGITAAIETDKCNPAWTSACNAMSAIVVPSKHALNSLNPSLLTCKNFVISESYDPAFVLERSQLSTLPSFSTSFNFLLFGQLTATDVDADRKNTFNALKWLFEEFKNDQDVGIVLKTNMGRSTIIDRNNVTDVVKKVINEVRQGQFPRVHLLHGDMSEHEVAALCKHEQIKAIVAPTRGEGFCLPLLEAAVSDLPVIATNWSGHLDFLLRGKFIELYYDLVEVPKSRIDNTIFMQGARWANVSEHDFKKKIRKFRTANDIPCQWARELGQKLRSECSFENVKLAYDAMIVQVVP